MNGYWITGLSAGLLGMAISGGAVHTLDANHYGAKLNAEKAAHATDLAKINAEAAQQLSAALAKQQAAEGRVATVEQQFNDEVSKHASDSLAYRAKLSAGTQRVRVRVSSCGAVTGGQGTATAGGIDAAATYADLDAKVATSVFKVAADDQVEIDKLSALQAYVRSLQDAGYIGK